MEKNNKGFVMILFMAGLPVFISITLAMFSFVDITRKDLRVKYICRTELLAAQKVNEEYIQRLLKLNPRAELLRRNLRRAKLALARAAARLDPIGTAAASARIAQITVRRNLLATEQKILIRTANTTLKKNQRTTLLKIQKAIAEKSEGAVEYKYLSSRSSSTSLAVRPTSSDIAPSYERVPRFRERQSMESEWQYQIKMRKPFSAFIPYLGQVKKSCAVTLHPLGGLWKPRIHEVKSLSNSVW